VQELKLPRCFDGSRPQSADVRDGGIGSEAGCDEKASQERARAPNSSLTVNGDRMSNGSLYGDKSEEPLKLLGSRSIAIGQRQKMESKACC
jgi:hypothetical protein